MRWYRQAYDREVREGMWQSHTISLPRPPEFCLSPLAALRLAGSKILGGAVERNLHLAALGVWASSHHPVAIKITRIVQQRYWCALFMKMYADNMPHRKPPSWARAPSSTRGCSTSSRPSVSEVSPSTLPSGSSRHQSTMVRDTHSRYMSRSLLLTNYSHRHRCPRPS